MVENGIGLSEALLGLDGFRVLEVTEGENEVVVRVETTAEMVACPGVGSGTNRRIGLSVASTFRFHAGQVLNASLRDDANELCCSAQGYGTSSEPH